MTLRPPRAHIHRSEGKGGARETGGCMVCISCFLLALHLYHQVGCGASKDRLIYCVCVMFTDGTLCANWPFVATGGAGMQCALSVQVCACFPHAANCFPCLFSSCLSSCLCVHRDRTCEQPSRATHHELCGLSQTMSHLQDGNHSLIPDVASGS